MPEFPTTFNDILTRIDQLDMAAYSESRNYLEGTVSRLSPYISRGAVTLPFVLNRILERSSRKDAERFIYELAWREYFQRVWHLRGWEIMDDMFGPQQQVLHHNHIKGIVNAMSGIEAIDKQITGLYATGYMHNHARMYVASLTCNIGRAHWKTPAQWIYYHLLDGDLASNSLSWQWIAGTFSSKKYYCNQSNINRFCGTNQTGTFLDCTYEEIERLQVPTELEETEQAQLPDVTLSLSPKSNCVIDHDLPLLLYNSYNLDPLWRSDQPANRVFLIEPSHFKKFPVSKRVLDFMVALSANIPEIQVFVGELDQIEGLSKFPGIYSKSHPAFKHYPGAKDQPEWMFPEATVKSSFSSFWKSCGKRL